jgi:hypothetical protein
MKPLFFTLDPNGRFLFFCCCCCFIEKTLILVSLYAMGRDPALFSRPDEFDPARWVRSKDDGAGPATPPLADATTHHCAAGYSFLPFGVGPRACVGRRLAEVNMYLLIAKVDLNFWTNLTVCDSCSNSVTVQNQLPNYFFFPFQEIEKGTLILLMANRCPAKIDSKAFLLSLEVKCFLLVFLYTKRKKILDGQRWSGHRLWMVQWGISAIRANLSISQSIFSYLHFF